MPNYFHKEESAHVSAADSQIVFTMNIAGDFKFINAPAERLSGYSCKEAQQLNVLDFLPGKSAAEMRALVKKIIRHRFGTVFEIEIVTRTCQRVRLEASVDVVRRADGELEFHGIAFTQETNPNFPVDYRRCLDNKFAYNPCKRSIRPARL